MATAYLRDFVESVADLPAELQRTFALMRELDASAAALQASADAAARTCLLGPGASRPPSPAVATADGTPGPAPAAVKKLRPTVAELKAMREKMDADMKQVLHYSNEKAQLAQQIYDSVDAKIRRLDKDLAAFDAELAAERVAAGLPPGGLDALAPVDPDGGKGKRKSGGSRKRKGEADPAEPVYCYCQRVSFGDMVACDNPDCAIEWFHYECAGISPDAPPKGKWFCRECAAARAVAGGPGEGGV